VFISENNLKSENRNNLLPHI